MPPLPERFIRTDDLCGLKFGQKGKRRVMPAVTVREEIAFEPLLIFFVRMRLHQIPAALIPEEIDGRVAINRRHEQERENKDHRRSSRRAWWN